MMGKAKQKITADYILDLYQESKKRKGKEGTMLLQAVIELSKHLNEWLVVPEEITKYNKKA